MTDKGITRKRRVSFRTIRWLVYLLIVAGIAAWRFLPRPWHPTTTLETPHYVISSTATREQTEEIGRAVEILYLTYSNRFGSLKTFQRDHPKLRLLLYRDRNELRRINPGLGWAEAFYSKPYCRAYFSAREVNSLHWMLHEAVHQLNEEVAHLRLAKWLEEGSAEYFSTSRMGREQLALGRIDPNTYPVWWIDEMATGPDLKSSIANGSVIPLRAIVSNRGGPSMRKEFNRYYLHWWTLTHFVFEHPRHSGAVLRLMERGGGVESFEQLIGPVQNVEGDWYQHVLRIKAALAGSDPEFRATGALPD